MRDKWTGSGALAGMMRRVVQCLILASVCGLSWSQVSVSGAWVRPVVQGQQATGAFMTVSTAKALKLTQVSSDLAGVVQLHSMSMQGNVMKMQAVSDLMVLPGSPLVLAPGGYHLMLMDLKPAFAQAKSVSLSLTFKDEAGKETILKVDAPIQMTPQHEPSSHEGGMEHMHMSH